VVVEPPLPEGREATGLKKFMESKTHAWYGTLSFQLIVTYIRNNI